MGAIDYASVLKQQFKSSAGGGLSLDESARLLDLVKEARAAGADQGRAAERTLRSLLEENGYDFDYKARLNVEEFLARPTRVPEQARQLAEESFAKAKAEGLPTIEPKELGDTYARIEKKYGREVADAAVRSVLGDHAADLSVDAAQWLQGHIGSMDGHISRYQRVLEDRLRDAGTLAGDGKARLVDANGNGRIDKDDVVVYERSGAHHSRKVGEKLAQRVEIGAALVSASYDMAAAGHEFATIDQQTFNSRYWTPSPGDRAGTFRLKKGANPSEALLDVFKNPGKYKFECATAMVIAQYKAMYDLIGPEAFDKLGPQLRMGPWVSEGTLKHTLKIGGSPTREEIKPGTKKELRVGDYAYFRNWDVSEKGLRDGWQGENVIYLGDGKYYGHPFGVVSAKHIIEFLNTQRKEGSTRSASQQDLLGVFDERVLRERRLRG